MVVLATPYDGALQFVGARAQDLAGKVVVDITNPVDWATFDRLVTPADSSAAEEIAKLVPGATVVKVFNTTFAGTLASGEVAGGMLAVDAGPLRRAAQLEHLGFLHMAIPGNLGSGSRSAVKFVTP